MLKEEACLRLTNWRRVYADHPSRWISPTEIYCRYARANCRRSRETPEEKARREGLELLYREKPLPAPDYEDAHLLNDVWASMPDYIENIPVKKNIKAFVFGTQSQLDNIMRKCGVRYGVDFVEWRDRFVRLFFERVSHEEEIRRQLYWK